MRPTWISARRVVAALIIVGFGFLFVAPLQSYQSAQGHLARARTLLASVQAQNTALTAQLRDAQSRGALITQARALGYIFPGETPYVVIGP
jgi:cell division protein FtsB